MVKLPVVYRLLGFSLLLLLPAAARADFPVPTPQELSMTAEPLAPDAAAIYLYREEIDDDKLHMHSVYVRLKVLTEQGKHYADVEIPYGQRGFSVASVAGRTIHSDGTVVLFTGKPYDRVLVKAASYQYHQKVFSMPDVQVGSVLEYKYEIHYDDHRLLPPVWFIQGDLFLKKAHFRFVPYEGSATSGRDQRVNTLTWLPILPRGTEVKHIAPPGNQALNKTIDYYDLSVENILSQPREEYMPPIHSLTYRVYFLYSPYTSAEEFWKKEGQYWAKQSDKFIGPGPQVGALVNRLTTPSEPQEQKLRKLYAELMTYENTDFTREHTSAEEKAAGLRVTRNADDVAERKRGDSDDIAMLFVSMARAAGMKAYMMKVTGRESELFNQNLESMDQLDSTVAIVNVGGKEQYFDPGERYCPYGQLRWNHTMAGGIRQTDGASELARTPGGSYSDSRTVRKATLTLDQYGQVSGIVQMGYNGNPALYWRQRALREDHAEVEKQMEEELRRRMPSGLNVKLDHVLYLDDPTRQLVAVYSVNGPLGNATSKRLFVPIEIFEANQQPQFTQPKRENLVYLPFSHEELDQVDLKFPETLELESAPAMENLKLLQYGLMQEGSSSKSNTLTLTRSFLLSSIIFDVKEYDDLRTFYGKVNRKDHEQAVFKMVSHEAGN